MKHSILLLPLAIAAVGAVLPSDDDSLVYAPEEDSVLTRTHESEAQYSLTKLVLLVQDEELEIEEGFPSRDIEFRGRIVVTDEILTMGEGRPEKLERTFDELAQSAVYVQEDVEEKHEIDYESALEGATVVVTWDEDDEEYSFSPAEDEELDEDLLDFLTEDMDFRAFLPEDEVAEDDTWDLDLAAYLPLAWPGGNLRFIDEEEGLDEEAFALSLASMEALEAEGEATFEGIREEDELRLAVISFEFESEAEAELEIEMEDQPEGVESVYRGREISGTIEGELLWDLDRGHLHSLTAESETEVVLYERKEGEIEGEEVQQTEKQVLTGTGTQTVTVERE